MAERSLLQLGKALSQLQITSSPASRGLINHQQVRYRLWANKRPILGWPRPTLGKMLRPYPEPNKYNWLPYLPEDGLYTTRPLPIHKMGGRSLEDGRVVVRTLGGGNPKKFRWLDMHRRANPDGSCREEQVILVRYDPLHTPKLALVADEERSRWIPLTHDVKIGDVIRTYSEIPRNPIRAKIGDAHPIGALPTGTMIHLIEKTPGSGAKFCLVAGSCAEIVKRAPDGITVKLPYQDTFKLDKECMAVVGQVSNVGHKNIHLMCPQRVRWKGKRPKSGQWHKKDGYCGKKIYPPKFFDITLAAKKAKLEAEKDKDMFDMFSS